MRIIVIDPDRTLSEQDVEPHFRAYQSIIGGTFLRLPLSDADLYLTDNAGISVQEYHAHFRYNDPQRGMTVPLFGRAFLCSAEEADCRLSVETVRERVQWVDRLEVEHKIFATVGVLIAFGGPDAVEKYCKESAPGLRPGQSLIAEHNAKEIKTLRLTDQVFLTVVGDSPSSMAYCMGCSQAGRSHSMMVPKDNQQAGLRRDSGADQPPRSPVTIGYSLWLPENGG